jgi:hypothetical protein
MRTYHELKVKHFLESGPLSPAAHTRIWPEESLLR